MTTISCTVLTQAGGEQSHNYRNVLGSDGRGFRILRQDSHKDTVTRAASSLLCWGGLGLVVLSVTRGCVSSSFLLSVCPAVCCVLGRPWGRRQNLLLSSAMQYVWGVRQQTQIRPLDNTVMIIVAVWTHVSRMSAFIFHIILVIHFPTWLWGCSFPLYYSSGRLFEISQSLGVGTRGICLYFKAFSFPQR